MKKIIAFLLFVVLSVNLAGCASVQKKFTRKKKIPSHIPATVYFEEGPYQKKYSNAYYYKTRYTMWKSWQDDLINGIGGNRKKTQRNAEEALNHLTEMSHYLVPEKEKQLEPLLEDLTQLAKKFETGAYSSSQTPGMRVELQKIKRLVANDFYYDKVANQILPDTVNVGPAAPAASSPSSRSSSSDNALPATVQ